mgnify:CR=1 FL=1
MNKRLFVVLVVLMSLALIGIVFVQVYFLNNSYENKAQEFNLNVRRALSLVSKEISDIEHERFFRLIEPYVRTKDEPDSTQIYRLFFLGEDDINDEIVVYKGTVKEELYRIPSLFSEIDADSMNVSLYSSEKVIKRYNNSEFSENKSVPISTYTEYSDMEKFRRDAIVDAYDGLLKDVPIYKRINKQKINYLLTQRFKDEGINIDFEYSIYDDDLPTNIQSDNFEYFKESTIGIPIFLDKNNESEFTLWVNFPMQKKYLFSSITVLMILSIFFTSIIIVAFSSAIYQIIKQRRISQIKSDFINNMTHEFKTPIATINLALDSIKNPKIFDDKDKVLRYLGMIKDENKRMHAQVENVLRISKLDKKELDIKKERIKLHDLIEDAVHHVDLMISDRQGKITTHLNAQKSSILANDTHFTNVIVNMLENAIKYSEKPPIIDVYTENVGENIILKIKDQGIGMSKQVQKRIFEKFYREHTGDVHNVKGHGLGLVYVKRIVEDHQGYVSVESEKGKGSLFTVKLPLIS